MQQISKKEMVALAQGLQQYLKKADNDFTVYYGHKLSATAGRLFTGSRLQKDDLKIAALSINLPGAHLPRKSGLFHAQNTAWRKKLGVELEMSEQEAAYKLSELFVFSEAGKDGEAY